MRMPTVLLALAALPLATPALARVDAVSDAGFVSRHEVLVGVNALAAWDAMLRPQDWWNGDHTYSGDPAMLSLERRPGGCFCEQLPGSDGDQAGGVEHMRVLYISPRQSLRLEGAFGPLQGEGVRGVLTIGFEPDGDAGTKVTWEYVVGGYSVASLRELAPLVDQVLGEQLLRYAAELGTTWDGASRRAP